jgi:hypothetical protein
MLLYSVNAITTGTDARGEVTVRLGVTGASSTAWVRHRYPGRRPNTSTRSTSCTASRSAESTTGRVA